MILKPFLLMRMDAFSTKSEFGAIGGNADVETKKLPQLQGTCGNDGAKNVGEELPPKSRLTFLKQKTD